jgi:hypothetical protein
MKGGGKPPLIEAISATVLFQFLTLKPIKTTIMATNEAGTALVTLGKKDYNTVKTTKPSIINMGLPDNQTLSPFTTVLNCSS